MEVPVTKTKGNEVGKTVSQSNHPSGKKAVLGSLKGILQVGTIIAQTQANVAIERPNQSEFITQIKVGGKSLALLGKGFARLIPRTGIKVVSFVKGPKPKRKPSFLTPPAKETARPGSYLRLKSTPLCVLAGYGNPVSGSNRRRARENLNSKG